MPAFLLFLGPIFDLLGKIPGSVPFGSIFKGFGDFFGALFANIKAHWAIWLVGVLIAGNLFTGWEWRHTDALLIKERALRAYDIASFKKAQADANLLAQSEKAVLQKESKADADQADANYTNLASKYHASLLRYATHQGSTQRPSDNQLQSPEGGNGPSPNSDLPATLVISGSDAEICAVNTARLQAVQIWAITLPKEMNQ